MCVRESTAFRITVAVVFGMIGFGINFLDIQLLESPEFKISILAGLFFPLLIALAWGWRFGLLSALAGGCQSMWWLWRSDGWGFLYAVPVFTLWIVWHGWWAERRRDSHPWYLSCFAVEIPFRIVIEIGFYTIFRWLVSFNPPPWNPAVTWDYVPLSWVHTVAIKHTVTSYILLLAAYVTLSLGGVRRFFGLRRTYAQKDTNAVYAAALLMGLMLWIIDGVAVYILFNQSGRTFWEVIILGAVPREVFVRLLYFVIPLCGAVFIARVVRQRGLLRERLENINRVLRAVRNVNQLITKEKDRDRLIRGACETLVETRGFNSAWIALIDSAGTVIGTAQAGIGEAFQKLEEGLGKGALPHCAREALEQPGIMIVENPVGECGDCPLKSSYKDSVALSVALAYEGKTYGVLSSSIPGSFARDEEERQLFGEMAGDIAFALYNKEQEEERGRVREALRDTESLYRLHFENVSDVIYSIDRELTVINVSPSVKNVLGYTPDELVGKSFQELNILAPEFLAQAASDTMRVLGGERVAFTEYQFITRDGTRKWGEVSGAPLFRDGRVEAVVSVARDITERKRAEAEREQLQNQVIQSQKMEAVGVLAGGVAHDFNNLLTTIIGNAQFALTEMERNDPVYEDIEEIRKAGERGADLTRRLLTFSRRETRHPETLDLNEIVRDMDKLLRRLVRENIEVRTVPAPDLWPVRVDPGQMEQVIMNLVVNARDVMLQGGEVTIETANVELDRSYFRARGLAERPGPYVMLAVTDTGPGMDEETMGRIFEPFFTTKERGAGTGLGLSTVYGVVKESGGYVWPYSEVGMGTTMKVYLPRAEGSAAAVPGRETEDKEIDGGHVVLVVEDDESLRKLAVKSLTRAGYEVLAAADGAEALRVSGECEGVIHLLLTDVVMPGLNGAELAARITALRPGIAVIYMSGYPGNALSGKGVPSSSEDFIQKPFTPDGLCRTVNRILKK